MQNQQFLPLSVQIVGVIQLIFVDPHLYYHEWQPADLGAEVD